MLDELCGLTGWSRRHARRALTHALMPAPERPRPKRRPTYDGEVLVALRQVWALMGGPCGKRLQPFLPHIVAALERHGELEIEAEIAAKLTAMSAATIDRALAYDRKRLQVKGRSGTKPGSLLRTQIPIRTFAEWDDAVPGFCEVDLVAHDGGSARGDFCQTLNVTDVASGWTEMRAVKNKAQRWVHEALVDIETEMPLPLVGLDSDNGSEFINVHLFRWCNDNGITFTRSRPFRKNDNCFVEQKNWTVVRQSVGYARFASNDALAALNELYGVLRLWVNFFSPQQKLISKTRKGAKVSRRYDRARTPYQRLLESPTVSDEAKARLEAHYVGLNPVTLAREISRLQNVLVRTASPLSEVDHATNFPSEEHPWRRSLYVRQRIPVSRTS